jgi:predicted 2-oxoglutarate/Fe(II)-dependent dioxygenase YbiX
MERLIDLGVFARPRFLSAAECAALRIESTSERSAPAEVVRNGTSEVNERFRRGATVPIAREGSSMHKRLLALLPELEAHFQVQLSNCDPPKLLVYRRGDFFRAHRDRGDDERVATVARRQVSTVTFLEDGGSGSGVYAGGELRLYLLREGLGWEGLRARVEATEGLLIAFAADVFHEVTPVRWGERHTVVSWFY